MSEQIESLLVDDDGTEIWWPHCQIDGCKRYAMLGRSPFCHPHTYPKAHHKAFRFVRSIMWRIETIWRKP